MSMEELEKLVKILGYTTSTNDNEALNACRRANTLMTSMHITWEQLIKEKTIVVNEIVSNEPKHVTKNNSPDPTLISNVEIELMLRVCMNKTNFVRMNPTGQAFIKSLNDWYQRNHSLTNKQKEALKNWYNRI